MARRTKRYTCPKNEWHKNCAKRSRKSRYVLLYAGAHRTTAAISMRITYQAASFLNFIFFLKPEFPLLWCLQARVPPILCSSWGFPRWLQSFPLSLVGFLYQSFPSLVFRPTGRQVTSVKGICVTWVNRVATGRL